MQKDIHARIKRTAEMIAQSAGATADVRIDIGNPVTFNDAALTDQMLPTLNRVFGTEQVRQVRPQTVAEDFSKFQQKVPGLFFFLGITPKGTDPSKVAANHSPYFFVDEAAFPAGMRALANLALDYLQSKTRPADR